MRMIRMSVLVLAAVLTLTVMDGPRELVAQEIFEASSLTDAPRIASPMAAQRSIQKAYPNALQNRGVQGKVMLQFVVLETGKVEATSIQVQYTDHAELGEAAKAAVAAIEFVPGRMQGTAVATRVTFPISFVAR